VGDRHLEPMTDGQVVGRVAGDEVVIINFATGLYYSLGGAGVSIWPLIERGIAFDALCAQIATTYGADADQVRADLAALIDALVADGLIRASDAKTGGDAPAGAVPAISGAYAKPELIRFDDLAESFAIDPPLVIGR